MVSLKKVDITMFPQFYPLLRQINPELSETEWYGLFTPQWHQPEKFCGYGLFCDSEMVGFLGFVFSQRTIDGQLEKFCNLTSWIVKEQYQGHGISLMLALRKLKDYTITDLSASGKVITISKKLGFKELDNRMTVLPSMLGGVAPPQLKIFTAKSSIQSQLKPPEQILFADHSSMERCHHLLANLRTEQCYVIFTVVKNAKFPYSYVQYLGNPQLFTRYSLSIRRAIAKISRTSWVLLDYRMLQGTKPAFCFNLPIEMYKLYKSSKLKPEQVDNLYSELVILDFTPIPNFAWHLVKDYYNKHPILANN